MPFYQVLAITLGILCVLLVLWDFARHIRLSRKAKDEVSSMNILEDIEKSTPKTLIVLIAMGAITILVVSVIVEFLLWGLNTLIPL